MVALKRMGDKMESMEMNGGQNGGVGMNGGQNGVNGDEWGAKWWH